MKILLWTDSYLPYRGGIERMTETLALELAARGCEVSIVTSHFHRALPDEERIGSIAVYRYPFHQVLMENDLKGLVAILGQVSALKRLLRPDLVHLQLQSTSSFFHVRTAAAWPCPTVLTVHGEFGNCVADDGSLLGTLLHQASWVTAVSQALLDDLRSVAPYTAMKSSLVYNSRELALHLVSSRQEGRPVIFGCGRLVADKGFDLLIAAFHLLVKDIPEARLVIAGDGVERDSLERQAEALGVLPAVRFAGPVSDDELYREMAGATMLVVPSRWREGFGLVALEGALLGLPVVATRVGGLEEVIEDQRTGVLVSTEDANALYRAMLQLLRSPEQRRLLGEAARKSAKARFNISGMIRKYRAIYDRVLRREEHG